MRATSRKRSNLTVNRRGDTSRNMADLYAQLQAPAQRAAARKTMQESVTKGIPILEPLYDKNGQVIDANIIYGKTPSYEVARRAADVAAYAKTIDPRQLAAGIGSNVSPRNITNAYIDPVSEGAYETTPQFDWSGRQVAGTGARRPGKQTATDRMMHDLSYGRDKEAGRYQDAIDNAITAAEYQQGVAQSFYEQQRIPNRPDSSGSNILDPDYYYNLQRSTRVDLPDYNRLFHMRQQAAREQAQIDAYQASQTTMSKGFFSASGSNDSPTSFPAGSGYRL